MKRKPSLLRGLFVTTVVSIMTFLNVNTAVAVPPVENSANYIVTFTPEANRATEVADARAQGLTVSRVFENAISGMTVSLTPGQLKALFAKSSVASIEIDAPVKISETQSGATWGIDRIDQRSLPLDSTYSYATNPGLGVRAYVIDTGLLTTHSEFAGRVAQGWSTLDNTTKVTDCNGHGTHVAGTVAGSTFGVAKAATLVPVRVLDCAGSGTTSGVIAGIDWVIGNHAAGTPAVANLSLGGGISSAMDTAIQSLTNDGVTVVVAAGNAAVDACTSSPARAPSALTVAASDSTDAQASFSNFGSCVDLYGPGVGISSAWYTGTSSAASLSGTSMAAPHVAGAAAIVLGTSHALTPTQVSSAVVSNATTNVIKNSSTGTPNRLVFSPSVTTAPVLTAPAAPSNVTAVAVKGRAATVKWTQGNNGGSVLTKQTVYVYNGTTLVSTITVGATVSSTKVSGLTAGKSYKFAVSATNALGTSPLSSQSNAITAVR